MAYISQRFTIYKDVFNGKRKTYLTRIYLNDKLNLNFSIGGEDCVIYTSEQDAKDMAELIMMELPNENLKVEGL